ncbi:unnamed protein product [Diamesa serratosioi]
MRQKLKNELVDKRTTQRLDTFDEKRSTPGPLISQKDVVGMCSRIKRKKHASKEDMARLSTAFLQNKENISVFIKVTGAINVIIKEFTGCESATQIDAAEVLCNLSLGDETCCEKIASVAGTYLTIFILNIQNMQLTTTCLWIIQNLAASGDKPLDTLFSQDIVKKSIQVFTETQFPGLRLECLKLLDIIIMKRGAILTSEDKQNIQKCLINHVKLSEHDAISSDVLLSKVLYSILIANNFALEDNEAMNLLEIITMNTITLHRNEKIFNNNEIIHLLYFRLLSKLFEKNQQYLARFLKMYEVEDFKLSNLINDMTLNPRYFGLVKELLWLAGNIIQSTHCFIPEYLAFDDFTQNLKISKIFNLLE